MKLEAILLTLVCFALAYVLVSLHDHLAEITLIGPSIQFLGKYIDGILSIIAVLVGVVTASQSLRSLKQERDLQAARRFQTAASNLNFKNDGSMIGSIISLTNLACEFPKLYCSTVIDVLIHCISESDVDLKISRVARTELRPSAPASAWALEGLSTLQKRLKNWPETSGTSDDLLIVTNAYFCNRKIIKCRLNKIEMNAILKNTDFMSCEFRNSRLEIICEWSVIFIECDFSDSRLNIRHYESGRKDFVGAVNFIGCKTKGMKINGLSFEDWRDKNLVGRASEI